MSPLTDDIDNLEIEDAETVEFFNRIKDYSSNYRDGFVEDVALAADGFYLIEEFNGSDRAGIEFLEEVFNCEKVNCFYNGAYFSVNRYRKLDETKRAFLYFSNQDSELAVLKELV